jgi:hypothetical protein
VDVKSLPSTQSRRYGTFCMYGCRTTRGTIFHVVQPRGGLVEVDVPEVKKLTHSLTDRLTVMQGWSELGEYALALQSLSLAGELLTQIYRALQTVSPPC